MPTRVAINGFGRFGRSVLRSAYERRSDVEIVAVNDLADADVLAHLLRHDSVYGAFPGTVESRVMAPVSAAA
jgi:glyceraldehyde 3-phosphate dehydrogenase